MVNRVYTVEIILVLLGVTVTLSSHCDANGLCVQMAGILNVSDKVHQHKEPKNIILKYN